VSILDLEEREKKHFCYDFSNCCIFFATVFMNEGRTTMLSRENKNKILLSTKSLNFSFLGRVVSVVIFNVDTKTALYVDKKVLEHFGRHVSLILRLAKKVLEHLGRQSCPIRPGDNFINVLRARFLYKILVPKITKLAFGF